MEPELAIDASREAIKVCFMVGGPILGVCLAVGLLMGLAQAMSHIQDQALATVPKILTILAIVALALPWLADQMMDFSEHQFSSSFMSEGEISTWSKPSPAGYASPLLATSEKKDEQSYYPTLQAPRLELEAVTRQASHTKPFSLPNSNYTIPKTRSDGTGDDFNVSPNPFSLPSFRFSKRPSENIEG